MSVTQCIYAEIVCDSEYDCDGEIVGSKYYSNAIYIIEKALDEGWTYQDTAWLCPECTRKEATCET